MCPGARGAAELRHELHERGIGYGARRARFLLFQPNHARHAHKLHDLRGVLRKTACELLIAVKHGAEQNPLLFEGCTLRCNQKRKHPLVSRVRGRELDSRRARRRELVDVVEEVNRAHDVVFMV